MNNKTVVLIGYWPLNETTSSTAHDHSGNENHGTLKNGAGPGGTGTAEGLMGQSSYVFDGNDDYITFGSDSTLDLDGKSFSVSFWINLDDLSNRIAVLDKGPGNDTRDRLHVRVYTDGQIKFGFYYDDLSSGSDLLSASTWHHVALTYNSSNNERNIYVDGEKVASDTSGGDLTNTDSDDFEVGRIPGLNNEPLTGRFSELRLYKRAITSDEIQYLYTVSRNGRQVARKKST